MRNNVSIGCLALLGGCFPITNPTGHHKMGAQVDTAGPIDTASDPTSDSAGGDSDTGRGCANSVVALFPADLDTDAYFRTTVRATFTKTDDEPQIEVRDADGAELLGVVTVGHNMVSWAGMAPLLPLSTYTATLHWSCGTQAWTFTTNAVGAPITVDPVGSVYELALFDAQWVEPLGIGTLIASQLVGSSILVSPIAFDGKTIALRFAVGESGVQDLCVPTVDAPAAPWTDPAFALADTALSLSLDGDVLPIEPVAVSGALAADGSAMDGVVLDGVLDTRLLREAFPEIGTTDDSVCELVSTFGVNCVACADAYPYCLDVYIDAIDGPSLVGGTVVARTDADIAADPACP